MDQSQQACRVLIVEDEPFVREITTEFVQEAGFEVVTAPNAEQAVGLLSQSPDFEILFADINMPGSIDGIGLASYVRIRWPAMKVVLTSGRPPEPDRLPRGVIFIRKPYSSEGLATALRNLLDRP